MSRAASHRDLTLSVHETAPPASPALWVSLVLLGMGYLLVLLEPVLAQRVETWSGQGFGSIAAQRWFPALTAGGLALGGSAALLFVLTRLVRDVARRPYACLAPVLGVFCGFLLCGLRAKLPLSGVSAEHVGVLALVLAVLGGALVQERPWMARLLGLSLTVLPSLALLASVWTASGKTQLAGALWSLTPQGRAFLGLLAVSSVGMVVVALAARALHTSPQREEPAPQLAYGGSASFEFTPVSARVEARGSAREQNEDTLELPLDEEERALRKTGFPVWAFALGACALLVGLGVATGKLRMPFGRHETVPPASAPALKAPSASERAESEAAAAALRALIEQQPAVPTVEALPSAPEPAAVANTVPPAPSTPQAEATQSAQAAAPAAPAEALTGLVIRADVEATPRSQVRRASLLPAARGRFKAKQRAKLVKSAPPALAKQAASVNPQEPASAPAESAPVRQSEAKPSSADAKPAQLSAARPAQAREPKPEDLALKAAAAVPSQPKTQQKSASGDDSLDALMEHAVESKKKSGPQTREDDPIFGL